MDRKTTSMDPHQIIQHQHDEEKGAQRVTIVDAGIGDAIKEAFSKMELPKLEMGKIELKPFDLPAPQIIYVDKVIKEPTPFVVEKTIIVPEIHKIEVPLIVKEIEILKVPEFIVKSELKVIEVEKPVIIREYEKFPLYLKFVSIGLLLIQLINLTKSLMK